MLKRHAGIAALFMLALAAAPLAHSQTSPATAPATGPAPLERQMTMANANQDAMLIIEYTLQYDKGVAPDGGSYGDDDGSFESTIKEERPAERFGILVDGTHVVTLDLQLHPRFIKQIKVRRAFADAKTAQRVDAAVIAHPKQQNAVILELSAPLTGAKAVPFDAKREGPYGLIGLEQRDGQWVTSIQPLPQELIVANGAATFRAPRGLIVDKEGIPVGVSTVVDMPADGKWKGSPMEWPAFSAPAMKDLLNKVEIGSSKRIVPITLNFRSPKGGAAERFSSRDENATLQNVLGVFIDDRTVLVLTGMKPTTTARLERIRALTDPPLDLKFKASLMDYGAFVAQADKPASGAMAISKADISSVRGATLPAADILLHGETRVAYLQPRRILGYSLGFRKNVYPQISGDSESIFVFDQEGDLLAFPVSPREKAAIEERWSSNRPVLTSAAQIGKALASLAENSDPNNVPLTEEEENRLAWLGFELQGLSRDLARANNVSDQTQDGQTGGLVTYIYPESPAAKAGVQTGWILLRLNVEGQPKPIDVQPESDRFSDEPFPWEQLGTAPESVFDRIPTPWPSVETPMLRSLTDIGFGKKFTAEFAHDGKVEKKEFTIIEGPKNYANAPKFKHPGLGLTVRDMTYEVRRYFQKKDDEPGVVISKIELGSKASNAGFKPYEVITAINGKPVKTVKDFEAASKDVTDFHFDVKRMTIGRVVNVTVPAGASTETQPK